jgi:hypothetical protein
VKIVARTPIRPNHITVFHTALGVAAGFVISVRTPRAFLCAGVMFEARAILDCLDGVLARATKRSSPLGRALDQLGDTIGFLSLMAGGLVCLARAHGWPLALATILITMPVSGSCSAAWDLYRRRFASLLRDGYDTTEEDHLAICRRYDERPMLSLYVSRAISLWSWYTLGPQTMPRLRDRIARRDWPRPGFTPAKTELGLRLQEAAERNDPELRATLARLGIVAGDNIILLLTAGLLVGHYTQAFPVAIGWGVCVWAYTVASVNRYLCAVMRGAPVSDRGPGAATEAILSPSSPPPAP